MTWREIPWARIYEEEGALYDMGESSRTFCQECLSFAVCLLGLLVGPSRQQTAGFLLTCFLTEEKVLNVLRICSAWLLYFSRQKSSSLTGLFVWEADYCLRSSHC